MNTHQWIAVIIIVCVTAAAAVIDMRTRRLPNWFTVPVLAAGILFHSLTGGLSGLGMALGGFAIGFGILLVLWLIGGGGGGDVKLIGALGAWLGATATVAVVVLSAALAAVFSIIVVLTGVARHGYKYVQRRHLARAEDLVEKKRRSDVSADEALAARKGRRRLVPYALPVAFSTWMVLVWYVVTQGR
jgi:prepilin peptidase CpaA